ncbi:hypothetical protein Ade02nite_43950 [Paractinoplanes deccanensis]|uniref:DUF3618 domain-containing protein n=1 Tax=Paractinoplanes deccanensis TaxID=113561 RepID=A0ABQ3Y6Y8_9ACTN|nr:DUF3618 domain-containing protein [Actinoplanes deccanensis]GID75754.1 hypothetical protein Ade02nite_43950 [Actinoplanes deccanensis]
MSVDDKNPPAAPKPSIDELRAEIKATRAELGETVQALAAKADVKARAKDQVEQTKARAKDQVEQTKQRLLGKVRTTADRVNHTGEEVVRTSPVPLPLVVAGVVAIVGVILIVRGRRR